MTIFKKAAVLAVLFAGATSASASTLTYDFTNQSTGGWKWSTTVASDEVPTSTVNVTAGRFSSGNVVTLNDSAVASWTGHGLGVCGDVQNNWCNDGSHQVDGYGNNDLAIFDFGMDVVLESIEFGYVNNHVTQAAQYDWVCTKYWYGRCKSGHWKKVQTQAAVTATEKFELFVDENGMLQFVETTVIGDTGNNTQQTVLFSDAITASSRFGIGARGNHDAFKIRSLTVSKYVAPVPLPASGLLLVGAVAGMAAMRRRRKAA